MPQRSVKIFVLLSSILAGCMPESGSKDPYLWLEDIEGERSLAWVERQNEASLAYLEALPTYEPFFDRLLEIYDSADRIAIPALLGDRVFNFWRDADNPRGLWRTTSLENYLSGQPRWQTVLDLDALAASEGEDWVWKGADCLRPDYRRCLLSLSRGGADAVVIREFDMGDRTFVDGGFMVPEAKTSISWIDRDSVFVGTDFGEGSLTDSGYPRTSRLWHRGEPLDEAREVFAGERSDVWAGVYRTWDGETPCDIAERVPSFFTSIRYFYDPAGEHRRIDIPVDAELAGITRGQLLVELKSAWLAGEAEYPQGALIAIDLGAFVDGARDFDTLVEPTGRSSIAGVLSTRDYLIVNILEDVSGKLTRFAFDEGAWAATPIETAPFGSVTLVSSTDESDHFFFTYESFLEPDSLYFAERGGETTRFVTSYPAYFDTGGMRAEQYFATSADGTRVPYFIVFPPGFEANGNAPTLMHGYGGFEVSRKPVYSATIGTAWLSKGGVYVSANIRGGGEYGPLWHRAALRENRQRAFDDFMAIAEDLFERGITRPERLGIRGGSNGGLLTGVMLTQRPELFGAIVVQVPLLDMKRYHKLLAGASWMAEYGDPDTDDWRFISRYSPYHRLEEDRDYPRPFVTTSTRDDRVHPGHARKMVAKMAAMDHEVLYYENTVGGHAGASDNRQAARVEALIFSYLWAELGGPDGGGR